MITDHFLEEFLKRNGFDEEIIKHIKPYNVEKQIKKIKELSKREIKIINNTLPNIVNKEYIFPLFYSLICKINIETIANYINFSSSRAPKKNKNIYYCNYETMENAMDSLTRKFNIDSIIFIIELIDEELCNMRALKYNKDEFTIDEINEKTFQVIKKIASSKMKYSQISSTLIKLLEKHVDKRYFKLLLDIRASHGDIEYIEQFYSLNKFSKERIYIEKNISEVIRRDKNIKILEYICEKFDVIKQIGWKRFISVNFIKLTEGEIEKVIKNLTVENFHYLLNYDGRFCKLLLYLIANDDNIANQLKEYINYNSIDPENDLNNTEEIIREAIKLYKSYKQIHPIKFLFDNTITIHKKRMLISLASSENLINFVLDENFLLYFKVTEIQNVNEIKNNIIKSVNILYSLKKEINAEDIAFLLFLVEHKVCENINDFHNALKLKEKIVEKGYKNIYFNSQSYIDRNTKAIKIIAKYINKPCLNLLLDCYFEGKLYKILMIDKFYSLNSVSNEPICIIGTSIEQVFRNNIVNLLENIYDKFDIIQQIGWKRFVSVNFTLFNDKEIKIIMKNLTTENFHYLLNYDGDFLKLMVYLISNDDNIQQQLIRYLDRFKKTDDLHAVEKYIHNVVALCKHSKPFEFMFDDNISDEKKDIITQLLLKNYPSDLVLSKDFIELLDDSKKKKVVIEGINNNINVLVYIKFSYEQIEKIKNVLEKRKIDISTTEEIIKTYLEKIEKDNKIKRTFTAYLSAVKNERKIVLYPVIIDAINKINQQRKSLFYLAFQKNVGFSLIETEMINLFKQFISI
ncbi:MAG: hypothetical protein N2505_00045 [Endomicrobia bacterium]|nr:hypothetical protein [Endomicrobiia bacterium]